MGKGLGIAILAAKDASSKASRKKDDIELDEDDDEYDDDEEGVSLMEDFESAEDSEEKYAALKALIHHCMKE